MSAEVKINKLRTFNIKGCSATDVELIDTINFTDRSWMLVDHDGNFLSQRRFPRMATITSVLTDTDLIVTGPNESSRLNVDRLAVGPTSTRRIWVSDCQTIDCGNTAAEWFSDYLQTNCRLEMADPRFPRRKEGAAFWFADSQPLTIINLQSVADLNWRIKENNREPVAADCFRGNIDIEGLKAYAEDTWQQVEVNGLIIIFRGPITRCPVTQVDQQKGSLKSKEPIKTLLTYRRLAHPEIPGRTDVVFGQKAAWQGAGIIKLNARLNVKSFKPPPELAA